MFLEASTLQALAVIAGIGGLAGIIGGFIGRADSLMGSILIGVIGGLSLSAIMRIAGLPVIYGIGAEQFSVVWGAVGGLVLGFVVGKAN